jgi:cytochrome c biogenesis protein
MTKTKSQKSPNIIWKFFSSVKLTVALLIMLAGVSIIGTVVPQQEGAVEYARSLSPQMLRIYSALDLFDMYHSLWFRLMMGFLALNLIICSLDRFPGAMKRFRALPRPDRDKPYKNLSARYTFRAQAGVTDASSSVARLLEGSFKRIQKHITRDTHYFYGDKGRFSHFGVYFVHLSVLLILVGALAGSFFGFEAYVNIQEGEKTGIVTLRKKMTPLKLGFEVRLDQFFVDFYETGAPKEYRSELTFIEKGKEVKKGSLLVNHPIQFRGITFYQSSYGKVPGKGVHLKITRNAEGREKKKFVVERDKAVSLPGGEGQFQVVHVRGDIMNMGPAVLIAVRPKNGEVKQFWIFQNYEIAKKRLPKPMLRSPKFDPSSFKPYTFFLDGVDMGYYSGLQVNRDPGVPLVWAGCFLMVAGFFVTFFTSHIRTWVRISSEKGEAVRISIAGRSNKNPVGLERELERLTNRLKNLFE